MPTEIWTATDLDDIRNNVGAPIGHMYPIIGDYIQMADIDLGVAPWNGGDGWVPIGGPASRFAGSYDGQNFKILNLTTNNPSDSDLALFGFVDTDETIQNVHLVDVDIVGDDYLATLISTLGKGNILNCSSTGTINTLTGISGGLIGDARGDKDKLIKDCWSSVRIEGNDVTNWIGFCGGLISELSTGASASVKVVGCYAAGDIVPPDWNVPEYAYHNAQACGGLIGRAYGTSENFTEIEKCFATGKVVCNYHGGGFVGRGQYVRFKNCYARGDVSTVPGWEEGGIGIYGGWGGFIGWSRSNEFYHCYAANHIIFEPYEEPGWDPFVDIGGFLGESSDNLPVNTYENCYYDTETSGQSDTGKGEPRLTAEMVYPYTAKHVSGTYVGWGFEIYHITDLTGFDFVFGEPWKHDPAFTLNAGYPQFEPTISPVDPTLTKIADCYTPTTPTLSISLDYGPFNSTVMERQDTMIAQYRFTNPPTGLTLKTKWRYLTPKLEHNVICGFECRGILIRYKLKGRKPKLIPEFE